MDKEKLDAFKKRLEARQRDLRQAINRTAQDGRDAVLESAQDIGDRATNKEFLFHQSNNERQFLQMVEGALDGIRDGVFGLCVWCGNEINPKRLEAVPWTRHCIACQEKLEQGRDAIGLPGQNMLSRERREWAGSLTARVVDGHASGDDEGIGIVVSHVKIAVLIGGESGREIARPFRGRRAEGL